MVLFLLVSSLISATSFSLLVSPDAFAAKAAKSKGQFCGLDCSKDQLAKKEAQATLKNFESATSVNNPVACAPTFDPKAGDDIAVGGRKVMAMMYGSCSVLDLPVVSLLNSSAIPKSAVFRHKDPALKDPKTGKSSPGSLRYLVNSNSVLRNHPYLNSRLKSPCNDSVSCNHLGKNASACAKESCAIFKTPPIYQYGGKGNQVDIHSIDPSYLAQKKDAEKEYYAKNHKRVRLKAASGIDCSSYVTESMQIMGLRAVPNQDLVHGPGTEGFWKLGEAKDGAPSDCFDRVSADGGIHSGDILIAPNDHVVVIDTVGADPFGIAPVLAKSPTEMDKIYRAYVTERGTRFGPANTRERVNQLKEIQLKEVLDGSSRANAATLALYMDEVASVVCESELDQEKFKITISNSSSHGELGIQRERIFPAFDTCLKIGSGIIMKAKAECVRALQQHWTEIAQASKSMAMNQFDHEGSFLRAAHCVDHLDEKQCEKFAKDYLGSLVQSDYCKTHPEDTRKCVNPARFSRVLRFNGTRTGCRQDFSLVPKPTKPFAECTQCCSTESSYAKLVPNDHSGVPASAHKASATEASEDEGDGQ